MYICNPLRANTTASKPAERLRGGAHKIGKTSVLEDMGLPLGSSNK